MIGVAGRFAGRTLLRAPAVRGERFRPSAARPPLVVRFDIEASSRSVAGVGGLVKEDCFGDHPPFRCNVVFACGQGAQRRTGGYADPWSPWFNVFYGGYQVDVQARRWGRPFGFRRAGDGFAIDVDELVQLGRADWDYLTAYPYGVPLEVIRRRRAEVVRAPRPAMLGRSFEGGRQWNLVEVDDVEVVSGYVSGTDGAVLQRPHPIWSPLWRACFGPSTPRPDHPESFPLVTMRARFQVAWERRGDSFHTFVCGGAVGRRSGGEAADALLEAQLRAVRSLQCVAAPSRSGGSHA